MFQKYSLICLFFSDQESCRIEEDEEEADQTVGETRHNGRPKRLNLFPKF